MSRRCCSECGTVIDSGSAKMTSGPLLIDRALRRANWRGHEIHFTAQEFDVLELLVTREGRVVQGWAFFACDIFDEDTEDKIVDVVICRLRAKFRGVNPEFNAIHTHWGEGFRWSRADGTVAQQLDRTSALRERVARAAT